MLVFHSLWRDEYSLAEQSHRVLSSSRISEVDSSEDEKPAFPHGKNELLTVGFNKDRSYVARGDKIGVFKATSEGKMEHHGTLSSVRNAKGKPFKPKTVGVSLAF